VPLSYALRMIIGVSANLKETKKILSEGNAKVNGIVRKRIEFPVGIFDVVEVVALKSKYRIILDAKGRIVAKKIDTKGGNFKVSKIVGKRVVKGGKIMVMTNDGFNIPLGKDAVNVEDSVKISLPERKIEEVYSMGKGSSAFIVGGVHTGKTVKIEGVMPGSIKRHTLVELIDKEGKFQTVIDNVFVVGKAKSEIEALS